MLKVLKGLSTKMPGNKYTIEYFPSVVNQDIKALPKSAKQMLQKAIEERLIIDSIGFGKPLRYSLKGHRRLRVSDYRIVYRVEAESNNVLIVAIKDRKDIYEE